MTAARLRAPAVAVASGLLAAAAFPPLDWGPLVLVALAPLCWLWHRAGARRAAWYGFLAGCGFFGWLLSWTWYFGAIAIVPLVAANAAYWAATGAAVGWFGERGVRSPWLTAAIWVPLEALRGTFPLGGLPWGQVGGALHDVVPARSLASWGGLLLVSFAVVALNGLVAEGVAALGRRAPSAALRAGAGIVALVLVVGLAHAGRIETEPAGGLRIAVLQGNDINRYLTRDEYDARVITEQHFALAEQLEGDYDLIIFPESALDGDDPQTQPALAQRIAALAAEHDSYVLVNGIIRESDGAVAGDTGDDEATNSNILYSPDGAVVGVYSKQHLVPFGEYVPFRSLLGWVDELRQVPTDFTPGDGNEIWDVRGVPVGTIICYESAYASLVRDVVRDGAEIVVVSTNNRSYRRSGNAAQHLALSQMRAAETGRPVVHASISGISAFIDADGNVHDPTELFVNEAITREVLGTTGSTPYVRFGDWAPWLCFVSVLGLAGVVMVRGRRARRPGSAADAPSGGASDRSPVGTAP